MLVKSNYCMVQISIDTCEQIMVSMVILSRSWNILLFNMIFAYNAHVQVLLVTLGY